MHRRIIYQALAFAVPFAAANANIAFTTTSHQVVSRSVVYEQDTSYVQTPVTVVTTAETIAAARPLDVPTRRTRWVPDYQELASPPPDVAGSANIAFATDSGMVVNRAIIYEELAFGYFPPVAVTETVTADKWWQQLVIPVRRRVIVEGAYSAAPPKPEANDAIGWHRALELPTRRKVVVEGAYSAAPPKPEAKDQVAWYKPVEAPWRPKRLPQGAIPFEARNAFPVVPWGWYAKLDEPFRIKRTPTGQLGYTFVAAAPGAGVAYNWFTQLDEPLRIKRTPKTELGYGYFVVPSAEVVTVDKWFVELIRPTRRTKPVPQQMGYTFVASAPGAGVAYNWGQPLDTPVRRDQRRVAFQQFASGPPLGISLGTSTLAATTTSAQVFRRSFIFDPTAIPVYFVPPSPGAGNELNWWPPLNEPVRPRLSIRSAQQWALTVPSRLLTTTLENAWFQRLNEPVRLKVTFGKYPGGTVQGDAFPPPVILDWYSYPQLAVPVRVVGRLKGPIHYPALTSANINPIVPFAWSWVDDPRRLRPRFNVSASAQGNINPIVPFAHTYLFTPHRLKGRIDRPAMAQQGALKLDTVEVGKFTQWWRQLDLPVREWRRIAWQWFTSQPPTGIAFFNEGGPADESERVACVPSSSRTAVEPDLLRTATVPVEDRSAAVPELLRVVDVPDTTRIVMSNDFRDRPCHDT